jgi:hypothetical protein
LISTRLTPQPIFRRRPFDETILRSDETVFRFSRKCPEAVRAYNSIQRRGGQSQTTKWMEIKMRALSLSLILGFTLVLSGVSMAGSSDCVPTAGMFTFNTNIVSSN